MALNVYVWMKDGRLAQHLGPARESEAVLCGALWSSYRAKPHAKQLDSTRQRPHVIREF